VYKIPANIGFKSNLVHYLPSCHSTNEIAANLLAQGLEEGSVIITNNQTSGKGQRNNIWESEPFLNLTFSIILKPNFLALQNQFQLTQVISISLASIIQERVPNMVKIKWPNDIYVDNKKIAGILIQNNVKSKEFEHSIVGIGININQTNFLTPIAVSLKQLGQKEFDLNKVLNDVLKAVSENYQELRNGNQNKINMEYRKLLYGLNEVKRFENEAPFAGKIIGTDPLGRLLIETNNGVRCFQNQEVKFIMNQ
jgi:BirA family transcriptional regulator, biotin operon repressor / biotin---[acetyl-CoA-carboxylase] ligase